CGVCGQRTHREADCDLITLKATMLIKDRIPPVKARLTLPSCLSLVEGPRSKMNDVELQKQGFHSGEWVKVIEDLPRGTWFGPLDTPKTRRLRGNPRIKLASMENRGGLPLWYDTSDPTVCNWMMLVPISKNNEFSSTEEESSTGKSNLLVVEHQGKVYFVTSKKICRGERLLAAYSPSYESAIGEGEAPSGGECRYCGLKLASLLEYRRHVLSHLLEHECPLCRARFRLHPLMISHPCPCLRNSRELTIEHRCDVCEIDVGNLVSTELHLRLGCQGHGRPHKCSRCEQSFFLQSSLDRHLCLLSGEEGQKEIDPETTGPGFICESCGALLSSASALNKHRATHASPEFNCAECGRFFHRRDGLEGHMSTHRRRRDRRKEVQLGLQQNQQPQSLNVVFKATTTKDASAVTAISSGNTPKSPASSAHCCNIHNGRVFTCPLCASSMKLASSLLRHLRSIHADRPDVAAQQAEEIANSYKTPPVLAADGLLYEDQSASSQNYFEAATEYVECYNVETQAAVQDIRNSALLEETDQLRLSSVTEEKNAGYL
ncbi:PR domain zinc finger protein-like, partial [Tropilaelaps mercedesae]